MNFEDCPTNKIAMQHKFSVYSSAKALNSSFFILNKNFIRIYNDFVTALCVETENITPTPVKVGVELEITVHSC